MTLLLLANLGGVLTIVSPCILPVLPRRDTATLELTAAELSSAHGRVYYFGDHFEAK